MWSVVRCIFKSCSLISPHPRMIWASQSLSCTGNCTQQATSSAPTTSPSSTAVFIAKSRPRLPRHNLRVTSPLVKQFAQRRGLEYAGFWFVEGNRDVLNALTQVADQARIVGVMVREEDKQRIGHHHH